MADLKRGVIDVTHPGMIADATRELGGMAASETPYIEGQRYLPMHDGTPAEDIPIPEMTADYFDVPAINSPQRVAQFMARSAPSREMSEPVPVAHTQEPEPTSEGPIGNYVHMDDGFAFMDGQMIPLDQMDLARIGGIVIRALERKMKEDYKRLKNAYTVQPRKRKTVSAKRVARKKAVRAPQSDTASERTEGSA